MTYIKLAIVLVALMAAAGCNSMKQGNTVVANAEPANARPAAVESPAPAQTPAAAATLAGETPDTVLTDLYKIHAEDTKNHRDQFLDGKSRKMLDRFFDKNLANLIWKDLTTNKGEVGVIDADIFYSTQEDPHIKDLKVEPPVIKGDTATDTVTFTDSGLKRTIGYSLVKENDAWKISDISYGKEGTLLKFFKEAQQQPSPN